MHKRVVSAHGSMDAELTGATRTGRETSRCNDDDRNRESTARNDSS